MLRKDNGALLILVGCFVATWVTVGSVRAQDPDPGPQPSDIVLINGGVVPPFPMIEGGPPGSDFAPAFFPATGIPDRAVLFFEDANLTILSDQLYVQAQQFYFASDPDLQNLGSIPVVAMLVETGAPQDVSGFFGLPPGSVAVQSDVPEPTTILLLGLSGLAMWARPRRSRLA